MLHSVILEAFIIANRWRKVLLTQQCCLAIVPVGDERYWKAQNLREEMVDKGESVKRTVVQRIYDIAGFKIDKEEELKVVLSSEKIATMYKTKMKFARSSEPVSDSFVDTAITTYKRILGNPVNQEILSYCDEHFVGTNHPFNSIYALQAVCDRASTAIRISFALEGLVDHYLMEFINLGEFTVSKLRDARLSYVCVLNYKQDVRTHLLGDWLDSLNISPASKATMRASLSSFKTVRSGLTPYGSGKVDLSWQAAWQQSAILTIAFLEDMIYTPTFDGRYRDAAKSHAEVVDVLQYSSIAERIKEIRDAIAAETTPDPTGPKSNGNQPSSAVADNTVINDGQSSTVGDGGTKDHHGFDSLSECDQAYWTKCMTKLISTYIKLIADTGSTTELMLKIQNSPLAMMRGDPSGLILYHFDVKKFGESTTRPDLRITPLRDNLYHRLVRVVLSARSGATTAESAETSDQRLATGELAVICDGGKRGNAARLLAPWKGADKHKGKKDADPAEDDIENDCDDDNDDGTDVKSVVPTLLQLVASPETLAARKKKLRGTLSLKMVEWVHIVSHTRISLPERPWKHHPGSNAGDALTNVSLPQLDDDSVWKLPWKSKKALYGKKHLIAVGGKTEGANTGDSAVVAKRTDLTIEPVCFHPMGMEVFDDILNGFYVKAAWDMTPVDEVFAWTSLLNRTAYIGITYTDAHSELLEERLLSLLKVHMAEPKCPLYNPSYAIAIGKKDEADSAGNNKPKKSGTQNAKAKAKASAKAKSAKAKASKKTAKGTKDADDEKSEPEEEEDEEGDDDDEVWDPLAEE